MNLFFRFVIAALRARFSPRTHINDVHVQSFRVWIGDQDMFQHMTNSRYTSFTDLAVINYLLRTGLWNAMRKRRWTPVIVYKNVRINKMLSFPQRFEVHTRIAAWVGEYALLSHDFVRRGKTTATSLTIGRFIGGRKDRPNIDDVLAGLNLSDYDHPEPSPWFLDQIEQIETARAAAREKRAAETSTSG